MRADEELRRSPKEAPAVTRTTQSGSGRPQFRDLEIGECEAILARNVVGRIAYSFRDRVGIQPISYVLHGKWIYGRTSASGKLDVLRHNRWLAFEVDEVDGMFDWRSVVVHGSFYELEDEGAQVDREAYRKAMRLVQRLVPGTGTASDPVPHRSVLFRIHVDELTGREATMRAD